MHDGYIALGGPTLVETQTELVNNNRVLAYIEGWNAKVRSGILEERATPCIDWISDCNPCPDAEDIFTNGVGYTLPELDPAPWYDPNVRDSDRFLGMIGLGVTGAEDSVREATVVQAVGGGGVVGPLRFPQREMVVRALAVAVDDCGMEVGLNWLRDQYSKTLEPCTGDVLWYLDCCPDCSGGPNTQPVGPCWADTYGELAVNNGNTGAAPPDCPPGTWWPVTYQDLIDGPARGKLETASVWLDGRTAPSGSTWSNKGTSSPDNDATAQASAVYNAGGGDGYWEMDATADKGLIVTDDPALRFSGQNSRTVIVRATLSALAPNLAALADKATFVTEFDGWRIQRQSANEALRAIIGDNTSRHQHDVNITYDTEFIVAMTWNGSVTQSQLYLDGTLISTDIDPLFNDPDDGMDLRLGYSSSGQYWAGRFYSFAMFPWVLTQEEIAEAGQQMTTGTGEADWCAWVRNYLELRRGLPEFSCNIQQCLVPYLRNFNNVRVTQGPIIVSRQKMHLVGEIAEIEFTIVAADPFEYTPDVSGTIPNPPPPSGSMSFQTPIIIQDEAPREAPPKSGFVQARAPLHRPVLSRPVDPLPDRWSRRHIALEPANHVGALAQAIYTVTLRAKDDVGLVRVGLWDEDNQRVAGWTIPFIPAGGRITIDPKRREQRSEHLGQRINLTGFAKDFTGEMFRWPGGLDPWSKYILTVDQTPEDEKDLTVTVTSATRGAA